jgi:hypothetical protein
METHVNISKGIVYTTESRTVYLPDKSPQSPLDEPG